MQQGRSREGAWIEMSTACTYFSIGKCRSREGAWIEIPFRLRADKLINVAPVRERGLKYYIYIYIRGSERCVAPVRERGLK